MPGDLPRIKRQYRSIFLSDIHLGDKACRADFLLDFFRFTRCETLYLVGDIVDIWAMKNRFHWPKSHHAVLKRIIKIANKSKTRVIYIPGNHDNISRNLVGDSILNIEVHRDFVHTAADGRRFLLCHGDEFDSVLRHNFITKIVGDAGYHFLLWLNRWGNQIRRFSGRPYWSAATYLKNRLEKSRQSIERFEEAAAAEAKSRGLDGVICGHIHQPELKKIDGVLYCNDGDWTESCTALVEDSKGWLELIHWSDLQQSVRNDETADNQMGPIAVLPNP